MIGYEWRPTHPQLPRQIVQLLHHPGRHLGHDLKSMIRLRTNLQAKHICAWLYVNCYDQPPDSSADRMTCLRTEIFSRLPRIVPYDSCTYNVANMFIASEVPRSRWPSCQEQSMCGTHTNSASLQGCPLLLIHIADHVLSWCTQLLWHTDVLHFLGFSLGAQNSISLAEEDQHLLSGGIQFNILYI